MRHSGQKGGFEMVGRFGPLLGMCQFPGALGHDPLQLHSVAVGCLVELGILNGQGHLSCDSFQELQPLLRRFPFGACEHTQNADAPAGRDQRKRGVEMNQFSACGFPRGVCEDFLAVAEDQRL